MMNLFFPLQLSIPLQPYSKSVYAYHSSTPLPVEGTFTILVHANNRSVNATFLVITKASTAILGKQTATALDLLRVGPPLPCVNSISEDHQALQQLLNKFNDRFTGLGQLKDVEVQIKVNPSVAPITQKPRRLPILLQKQVDQELDRLLDLGVLEKVDTPPTWVNPLHVAAKKNGGIRICVDIKKPTLLLFGNLTKFPH